MTPTEIEAAPGPDRAMAELDPELVWLLQKLFDVGCKNSALDLFLAHQAPRPSPACSQPSGD